MSEVNSPELKPELHKSSAEILSELFSKFNAKPPDLNEKILKKHKKSKKKHKHKEKKHKKKSKRKHSSESGTSSDLEYYNKHKSKKRHKDIDDIFATNKVDLSRIKIESEDRKLSIKSESNDELKLNNVKIEPKIKTTIETNTEKELIIEENENRKDDQGNNTDSTSKSDKVEDKSTSSKITIKSLKNSSVYEATIKEVEQKAREKAARFEEGELTDIEYDEYENLLNDLPDITKSTDSISSKHESKRKHHRDKHKSKDHNSSSSGKHSDSKKSKKDKDIKHHRSEKSRSRSKERTDRSDRIDRTDRTYHSSSYSHYNNSRSFSRYYGNRDYDKYGSSKSRRSRTRSRSRDRQDKSGRDRSSYRSSYKRRSKSPSSSIDKKKLLEIARKNAINMLKSGTLPEALTLGPQAQEKVIAAIKAGGKTIEELTDFCKNLSKKEELGELSSALSSNEDEAGESVSENEKVFHHPFQIKDKPTSIVMNIKNATPLPVKTPKEKSAELRMQFPVSSGQLHRKTENEWVPVSPKKTETVTAAAPPPEPPVKAVVPITNHFVPPTPAIGPVLPPTTTTTIVSTQVVVPEPVPTPQSSIPLPKMPSEMDISTIVSQRLNAMRRLQENPKDEDALNQLYHVQQEMQTWAQSKQQPGQFTGSTGAQILTPAELSSGYQAWARKDQLQNAAPVTGGMGMHLLQKMGWKPGEGLGKEKTGSLEPLLLEVKLDKKGLVANEEVKNKRPVKVQKAAVSTTVKTLAGKHPVSLLGEFATKRKLGVPQYECIFECGPDHKKNFLFKVILNGIEYKPNIASSTKKQAKADAATVSLQQLGLLLS